MRKERMKNVKTRAAALKRLAALEGRLRDLGRSRLAAIESEKARLNDELKSIFEALETSPFAYGASATPALRRARSANVRLGHLLHEESEARRRTESHGVRAGIVEQAAAKAAVQHRDEKERKALLEIVERAIARRDASQT